MKKPVIALFAVLFFTISNAQIKSIIGIHCEYMDTIDLTVRQFSNGDLIHYSKDSIDWIRCGNKAIPAFCFRNFDSTTNEVFYNWFAFSSGKNIAPNGSRLPTLMDFAELSQQDTTKFNFKRLGNVNQQGHFQALGRSAHFWCWGPNQIPYQYVINWLNNKHIVLMSGIGYEGAGINIRVIKQK